MGQLCIRVTEVSGVRQSFVVSFILLIYSSGGDWPIVDSRYRFNLGIAVEEFSLFLPDRVISKCHPIKDIRNNNQ